jgi:hypothetical protein
MSMGFAFLANDTVSLHSSYAYLHILSFSLYFYISFNPVSDLFTQVQLYHHHSHIFYFDYLNWAQEILAINCKLLVRLTAARGYSAFKSPIGISGAASLCCATGMRIKREILQEKIHSRGGITKTKTINKHTIKF